jgi:hypothetical protein
VSRGFAAWWREFRAEPGAFDDPHETARRLRHHVQRLRAGERDRFLDRLCRALFQERHAYGVGLFLLEGIDDPAALRHFARRLLPLPALQSEDEEAHLADLIRILAAAAGTRLPPVIGVYFLEREMSPHWASAPWALWPRRKELFARSWTRFFVARDPSAWNATLVVRAFLAEPAAIGVLRRRLAAAAPERWDQLRTALVRQAGSVGWLTRSQRAALQRVLR